MGLKGRMALAIMLLFALLFAVIMAVCYYLGWFAGWLILIPITLTILIVLFQWGVSPLIIRWIYKIRWITLEELDRDIADFIVSTCELRNINLPRLGIVEDGNPNAFCFGWTRNKSHLVITRGILHYCDKEEQKAVIGHELGHIAHNDFVVMTVVASVPLLFYVIFRGALYSIRYGGARGKGGAAVLGVAAVSFIIYLISQMIALLVSRFREYWADSFSAETTRDPNALASALVKIAYGLAVEGRGERSERYHNRYESALMIFNAKAARGLAVNAATTSRGKFSKENIKRAMAWDLWNPWAFFLELQMTHPLPAKRIKALGDLAEQQGQFPYIKFDLEKPECYWDDFFCNIFAQASWLLAIPAGAFAWYYLSAPIGIGVFFFTLGLCLFLYWKFYRYPSRFADAKVTELLEDPKASPIKGKAVRLHGRIIGRGQPGLFYSEDLKLEDESGLILLDYHQVFRFIDFLVGVFATEQKMGDEVVVEGWYRRRVVPYLEIYKMYIRGKVHRIWTASLKVAASVCVLFLGGLILLCAV